MAKKILAIVGMPGSGKSQVIAYLNEKGIPSVRFGLLTERELQKKGLSVTPENEKDTRESLRRERGMDVYAKESKPAIDDLVKDYECIAIDGLYSWEEYLYLKEKFKELILVHVFTQPVKRYQRLAARKIRSMSIDEGYARDLAELNTLNKAGPIAIADHLIDNNGKEEELKEKIEALLKQLNIAQS